MVRNRAVEAGKLEPLWTVPCEVLGRTGTTGRYTIAFPEGNREIHMERLKMYLPRIDGTKIKLHYYRPHVDIPEDDSWVVETILRHRIHQGKHQWLVRWRGYDATHDSWEPARTFVGYLQQDWVRFNRDNHITINTKDILTFAED